jgi:hypothetical protein
MENGSKSSITFECRTNVEADRIRYAVQLYRHVLKQRGQDPRNYAPATAEGAGFGWDAVERAARDMHAGSKTHMSRRMAGALMDALSTFADRTPDYDKRKAANWTAARLELLITGGGE